MSSGMLFDLSSVDGLSGVSLASAAVPVSLENSASLVYSVDLLTSPLVSPLDSALAAWTLGSSVLKAHVSF